MSAAQDDAAIVAAMVREFDFARYAASLFAPSDKRRAMLALAAFDLEIQRIPDQVSQPLPGEVRQQWWTDAIEGTAHGGVAGHPVAAELLRAIEANALPREPLLTLIGAHRFDLYDDPMPTLAALEVYCDDVCGSLVALCGLVLSNDLADRDAIRDAARALHLMRLVGRLPHDASRGRCFLPADIMASHGVTRHQVLAGQETEGLRAVRKNLIEAARRHARQAHAAIATSPRAIRPAFLPLATVTRELDELERSPSFALAPIPSRLRVLAAQWWMMR